MSKKIKPILIEKFIENQCFICKEVCEGYCHYECSIAYEDIKKKMLAEINKLDEDK